MSSQKIPVLTLTLIASGVLSAKSYVDANGGLVAAGAAGAGLVTVDADPGDAIAVDVLGTSTAIAGAAVAKGVRLQVGTAGKLITVTTGVPVAMALEAAAVDQEFEVLLLPGMSAIG